jgi:RecB family endonuclease NucS
LSEFGVAQASAEIFEVLGEKAFPEGHVDILVKEATPIGVTRKIIIEVKTSAATRQDLNQLKTYTEEIGDECIAAVLIARDFSPSIIKMAKDKQIKLVSYAFK